MFAHCGLRACVCVHMPHLIYTRFVLYTKRLTCPCFFLSSSVRSSPFSAFATWLGREWRTARARSARLTSNLFSSSAPGTAGKCFTSVNNDPCVTFLSVIKNTLTLCAELLLHRLLLLLVHGALVLSFCGHNVRRALARCCRVPATACVQVYGVVVCVCPVGCACKFCARLQDADGGSLMCHASAHPRNDDFCYKIIQLSIMCVVKARTSDSEFMRFYALRVRFLTLLCHSQRDAV